MQDLRAARLNLNYTQQKLADNSELTYVTISNIENGTTVPQNDCRRRLEMVLGRRINWLLTQGLSMETPIVWEEAETLLRKSLLNINALPPDQQNDFISMAREYLNSVEQMIDEADIQNNEHLLLTPNNLEAIRGSRKRIKKTGDTIFI